ncbi:MAG: glycoside hydrolase family 3 N-terminal domain-containing protein [Brumimicrobium sp.]|nr:glycoside hydrolase family 3 N-terminal domain-containing protein [Brumimicrobium sp.]
MNRIVLIFLTCPFFFSCAQDNSDKGSAADDHKTEVASTELDFQLKNYFSDDEKLSRAVDSIFGQLEHSERIAQMIMPAIGEHGQSAATIDHLVTQGKIGGLLLLNGTKEQFSQWVKKYDRLNDSLKNLPFIYSADAEPSLINRKIRNTATVPKANTLKTEAEVRKVAEIIARELNAIGINYNFAPVVDMSPNTTVGWRSFGHEPDSVIPWSAAFIEVMQNHQIMATAKHFPGHGFVEGDTHKKLVYINGEMKEVQNYPPLIKDSVMSVMIAHIAVENNPQYDTGDMPATTSPKIVKELLRDSLKFQGIIVTDALNMGGVRNVKDADLLVVEAGCDILLMPLDAEEAHAKILEKYNRDEAFKAKVDASVKRIIRAKLCLGLLHSKQ